MFAEAFLHKGWSALNRFLKRANKFSRRLNDSNSNNQPTFDLYLKNPQQIKPCRDVFQPLSYNYP